MPDEVGNHPIPDDVAQDVQGLLGAAHIAQTMGTSERQCFQVETSLDASKLFMMREIGFTLDENGQFVKEQTDTFRPLDCGCTATIPDQVAGTDYLSSETACWRHLVYCMKCRRPISMHNARERRGKVYCKPCAKKARLQSIVFFPAKVLQVILYGFIGREVERDEPSVLQPERRPEAPPYFPQPTYGSEHRSPYPPPVRDRP